MKTRIAVTGAGGPSAVSVLQALAGRTTELFAADIDPYAPGLYLVVPDHRWLVLRGDDPDFVDDVLARCVEHRIDVLIPTVDTELLPVSQRAHEFQARGTRVMVARPATLERCIDKAVLLEACIGVCPVPRTAILRSAAQLADWPLPCLVKPRFGAGGRGVRRIDNLADLGGVPTDGSFIVQEFLPGAEHSVDVLATLDAHVRAAVPRSRLKIDSGIAVTGMTVHDARLQRCATAVAEALGVIYVANIQFRDDAAGIPKLLDVNARFPGTMPLTIAAGVNMPCLALDMCLGLPLPAGCSTFQDIGMVRVWREHFVDVNEIIGLEREAERRKARAPAG